MSEPTRKEKVPVGRQDRVSVIRTFLYDFSVGGGAVGAVTLTALDGAASTLPAGAIITRCITKCKTALTSGGSATVALGITGATTAFEGATAYTDGSYAAANAMDLKTPSAPILVSTADSAVLATIATAALTAGKVEVSLEIILP